MSVGQQQKDQSTLFYCTAEYLTSIIIIVWVPL